MLNFVATRALFNSTRSAALAGRRSLNYVSRSVVTLKEVKVQVLRVAGTNAFLNLVNSTRPTQLLLDKVAMVKSNPMVSS